MAETPAHTDALTKGAGTRIQEQTGAMDQPVTVLESRDVIGADVYGGSCTSIVRINTTGLLIDCNRIKKF